MDCCRSGRAPAAPFGRASRISNLQYKHIHGIIAAIKHRTHAFLKVGLSMKQKNSAYETVGTILLAVVLIIQAVCLVHVGLQKQGMHIDEYYSYILSNSYDTDRISHDEQVWNTWLSGDSFRKYLTVAEGEQFSYGKVYYNNTQDAHPPLYYFLLHTLCSFFPEKYTPWFGLGLNIILILVTQLLLFCLAREMTGSSLWGVVPVALYGGMMAFFDTTLFIRMYALLTLFTVLLLFLHCRLIKNPYKVSTFLGCFVVTFLGVFTQYYFAFFAFFIAIASCIWLLCRHDYKLLLIYAGGMLFSVLCVFIVFPAGITQITGSETNNVGNEVWGNIFNFSGWKTALISMYDQAYPLVVSGILDYKWAAIGIAVTAFLLSCLFRKKDRDFEQSESDWRKNIPLVAVLLSLLIAIVALISHISGKFVYVRYIYNLFPVAALAVSMCIWLIAKELKLHKNILAIGVIVVWLLGTAGVVQNNRCSYLFTALADQDEQIMEYYEDRPLVMLNNGSTYQPTGLLHFLLEGDQVFLGNYNKISNIEEIFSQVDCSDGVVVIVLTDKYWSSGLDGKEVLTEIISGCDQLDCYEQIGKCNYSTVYLAYPETNE